MHENSRKKEFKSLINEDDTQMAQTFFDEKRKSISNFPEGTLVNRNGKMAWQVANQDGSIKYFLFQDGTAEGPNGEKSTNAWYATTQGVTTLKPKEVTTIPTTETPPQEIQPLQTQEPELASASDIRKDYRQQQQDLRQKGRYDKQQARQEKRAENKATRQQENECKGWFNTWKKTNQKMDEYTKKRYKSALEKSPCCSVMSREDMTAAGLTSCKPGTPKFA